MNIWQTKKLGEVCRVFDDGDWIESKDQSLSGIRLIQTGNIGLGAFKNREGKARFISETTFKRLHCNEIFKGDVLISRLPDPIGRSCTIPKTSERMITAVDCTILRFKPEEVISNYFNYYSQSAKYFNDIEKETSGTTRKRISRKKLGDIEITYPNITEQKRIVKILDQVFENIEKARQNTEKNLQNSKELFESYLQSVFAKNNWEKKTLKEIAITFGRGKSKHRPRNDKKLYNGKYPFIQTGDIRNSDHLITNYSQTYNEIGLKQSKLWPKGTVCITIAANIAETGILDFDACFPDSVIGIVVNPKIANSGFVEYLLGSFKIQIQAKGKGSAQANINMATFENQFFPFPEVSEQMAIVKKLDNLSEQTKKLEESYKQKLLLLDELKKSVLAKAFSGNL
jgi:type I restriction enzyme S subunit